jgi:Protein involved in cellulose biosynthesis (CelD)
MTTLVTTKRAIKAAAARTNKFTELLTGDAVLQLLDDSRFMEAWHRLFNACPWATVFQSPGFVATWYRLYGKELLPVLVKTEYAGKLTGLLTLVKDKNGLITGAGANQAEYQVWLGEDAGDESFIKDALHEVFRYFPKSRVQLKYIPAGVAFYFVKDDPAWNTRCFVKVSPQPLMIIDDAHITNELRKKNRREKMNRMKRMGAVHFERITDFNAFAAIFDELALQSDFRKGAMYNKVAFKDDPFRKKFLLELFKQGHLHATVLKINDKIIASNVSMGDHNRLHLQGINSFAAGYAKYSPGIIHFLLLGKMLAEEGIRVFDLTPGADAYKEILATDYAEAYTLRIGGNGFAFLEKLESRLNQLGKKAAAAIGIERNALKRARQKLMHPASWFTISRKPRRQCWEFRKPFPETSLVSIQKDDLYHLLSYEPRKTLQPFLTDAMRRLEEGGHCYSWAEEGVLLACAWVAAQQADTEGLSINLCELYCHPKARDRFQHFLQSLAHTLSTDSPYEKIYLINDYANSNASPNRYTKRTGT